MVIAIEHTAETICSVSTYRCPWVAVHINVIHHLEIDTRIRCPCINLIGQIRQVRAIFNKVRIGLRAGALCPGGCSAVPRQRRSGLCHCTYGNQQCNNSGE